MEKNQKLLLKLMMLFLSWFSFNARAQTPSDSTTPYYLMDLPLEQLMNIEVTVASKKPETIADAPGSITAYGNKEIENLGYYTLGDLANITAGYSAFKGIGETTFETRGQMQSGFDNNKHLVLVDGIPFNHARANMAPGEENLPLFFAQRVEFLKGPGSALYGTSAFSGVINVISKDLAKNGTMAESRFSLGTLDFKKRAMANLIHKTDEGISKINVGYFGKDATRAYLGNGMFPNANSYNNDNSTCLFLNASHKLDRGPLKGLGAGLIYSRKTGGLGEFWMFQQNQVSAINQLTWEQIVPYLKYERVLTDKLSVNSYAKFNMSTENAYTMGYQQVINPIYGTLIANYYNIRVYDLEGMGELRYALSERTNLIGGINVISRYSTGAPETYSLNITASPGVSYQPDPTFNKGSSTYNIYSGFAQLQHTFNILKGQVWTAGARWDVGRVHVAHNGETTNKYEQLSPRVAVVQKVTDKLNLKAMFGQALRVPLIKEVGLNEETRATVLKSPVLAPYVSLVPNVSAERMWSLEGGATYNTGKLSLSGTYFYNETLNALGAVTVTELNNTRAYTNLPGVISAHGFETEAAYTPTKNFKLAANYSYAKATLPGGNEAGNVPTAKVNGIFTYSMHAPVKVSATLIGRWIENYRTGVVNGFIADLGYARDNTLMPGFAVFDMNLTGQLTKNVSMEVQVRNILDRDITTPTGIVNAGMLNVPNPGRSFLFTLGFKF